MAIRPPAKPKDAPEIAQATLPNPANPLIANVEYWNEIPKISKAYDAINQALSADIAKAFKDSGFSVYLKPQYRFQDVPADLSYIEPLNYSFEVSYWSYGKHQTKEFMAHIIEYFKLDTLTARLSHDRNRIEFMYKGTRVVIHNHGPEFRAAGVYPENQIVCMLNGYNGELLKVVNLFLGKFSFEVDYMGTTSYVMKDGGEEINRYCVIKNSLDTVSRLLGTSTRNYGSHGYFRTKMEVADWLMTSKYISRQTFDLDENNVYVGPSDYYGSTLFRQLVEIVRTKCADNRYTPETLPETIKKYQFKIWQDRNMPSFKQMGFDSSAFKEKKMLQMKYSDELISEVTKVKHPESIKVIKETFQRYISEKEDFSFFILSSSEETIREKLAEKNWLAIGSPS